MSDFVRRATQGLAELAGLTIRPPSRDTTHGASSPRARPAPPLSSVELEQFERRLNVTLPRDYADFLVNVGNGGAGPGVYGVYPLGLWSLTHELEPWTPYGEVIGDPSLAFDHDDAWNLPIDTLRAAIDGELEIPRPLYPPVNGAIPIANHGCNLQDWLTTSGSVWLDDTVHLGGWIPWKRRSGARLSFSEWFFWWLDSSIEEGRGTAAIPFCLPSDERLLLERNRAEGWDDDDPPTPRPRFILP